KRAHKPLPLSPRGENSRSKFFPLGLLRRFHRFGQPPNKKSLPQLSAVRGPKILGSQAKQVANQDFPELFYVDTFFHGLNKRRALSREAVSLYTEANLSLKQIARRLGASRNSVRRALFRAGVPIVYGRRLSDL